jgi:hypothetical protein
MKEWIGCAVLIIASALACDGLAWAWMALTLGWSIPPVSGMLGLLGLTIGCAIVHEP